MKLTEAQGGNAGRTAQRPVRGRTSRMAPLLPREDAREAPLYFVVAALCFLAALAGMSARASYSAADAWTQRVTGEITVRVRAPENAAETAEKAVEIIRGVDGVVSARAVTRKEAEVLLKPWLGASGVPGDLPLPTLIAVESVADREPSATQSHGTNISEALSAAGIEAAVDDHVTWSRQVGRATDTLGLIGLGAVILLGAIAAAVIAFATHAALLARRDIVEVMHLCGARDRDISGLFENRFLMLGVQAGTIGALLALGLGVCLLFLARSPDPGVWLLPRLSLTYADAVILSLTPLAAGLTAMIAARMTVARSLAQMV